MAQTEETKQVTEETGATTENGSSADLLSSILSDPGRLEMLTKAAGALASSGMLSSLLGMGGDGGGGVGAPGSPSADASGQQGEAPSQPMAEAVSGTYPVPRGTYGGGKSGSRHEALLYALKPYLGDAKRERLEGLVRILRLVDMAEGVFKR